MILVESGRAQLGEGEEDEAQSRSTMRKRANNPSKTKTNFIVLCFPGAALAIFQHSSPLSDFD